MNNEGISLSGAKQGNISHCTLWDNHYAITIGMTSEHNIIYRNDIISSFIGISFSTHTRYNRIHHNNFIESNQHTKGPYNYLAVDNYWNASGEGNYWDDYDGRDIDGDNIGDTLYIVTRLIYDYFPLIFPYNGTIPPDTIPPYFINTPSPASRNLTMPRDTLDIDFMSSEMGHYEIIIDTDGVEGFDNTTDTTLTNRTSAYSQTVHWTGLDNEGDYIVDGEYGIQIMLWDLNGNPMDEPFDLEMLNILIDRDSDGVVDINDSFPKDPNEWTDLDGDGIGDNSDTDVDGDGVKNDRDEYPFDPDEWLDTDSDGIGNNADTDDDDDGHPDKNDAFPLDPKKWKEDEEQTGIWIWLVILAVVIVCILVLTFVFVKIGGKQMEGQIPPGQAGYQNMMNISPMPTEEKVVFEEFVLQEPEVTKPLPPPPPPRKGKKLPPPPPPPPPS